MKIKNRLLVVSCWFPDLRCGISLRSSWFLVLAAISFFYSCKKPPSKTKAQVIQERLDGRLDRWRAGVDRNCKKKVMDTAIAIVDSTLLANARLQRDTSDIPDIPERPVKPDFEAPKDSVPVKPILEGN